MKKHFIHLVFAFIILFAGNLVTTPSISLSQDKPWTKKADMKIPRYNLGVCEVNGKIYAIGGDDTGTAVNAPGSQAAEEYDPITNTWTVKKEMPTGRTDLSVAVVNGKIYAIGGWRNLNETGQVGLATIEMYDAVSNTWETKTDMPTARAGVATSVVNGKIYTFGGTLVPAWQNTNIVEVYDPATDTWETKIGMPLPRGYAVASAINDKIYVIGGRSDAGIGWSLNQEYDPVSDVWSVKSSMPHARVNTTASVVNDKIYVIGGSSSMGEPGTTTVQEYDPTTDLWTLRSPMPTERTTLGAAVFDDKVYAIGGSNVGWEFQPVATVEEYAPLNDSITDSITSVYEYQYTPAINVDPDGFAHYKIYIPDGIDTLKGVYCVLPGGEQTSLDVVTNSDYKAYAKEKGFALMGFHQIGQYYNLPLWSGEALILALKELAPISGHNGLEFAPLIFRGYSGGASFVYNFTQWKSERVIAFVSLRGTFYASDTVQASDASRKVPGYLIGAENDQEYRIKNMTNIFETHRPLGALWALAIEPNKGHISEFPTETMHSFLDEVIALRLPERYPVDSIPQLVGIDEETAWLGNRDNFEINSYAEYSGDKTNACWFPNEKIANEWLNLVHPATGVNSAKYRLPEQNQLFQNYPNPFNPSTRISYELPKNIQVILTIFNLLGQEIRTLVNESKEAGHHTVHWDGEDNFGKKVVSGVYLYQIKAGDFKYTKKMLLMR